MFVRFRAIHRRGYADLSSCFQSLSLVKLPILRFNVNTRAPLLTLLHNVTFRVVPCEVRKRRIHGLAAFQDTYKVVRFLSEY